MVYLIILIPALIFLIVFIFILRHWDIKVLDTKLAKIEFFKPKKSKELLFRPVFTIDPVVSKDGKVYKIHLHVSVLINKNLDITNWLLRITGLNKMVFKQYFLEDQYGQRIPLGNNMQPMELNKTSVFGLEFEPEKDYKEIIFEKKAYKSSLTCETTEGRRKFNFKFRVRDRNLKALKIAAEQAIEAGQAEVISFPII